jgi:hypothetical protein
MLLHPLLAGRWSPTTFDPSYVATPSEVATILEAARWAPSVPPMIRRDCGAR